MRKGTKQNKNKYIKLLNKHMGGGEKLHVNVNEVTRIRISGAKSNHIHKYTNIIQHKTRHLLWNMTTTVKHEASNWKM
jgi:hypothetical protein